MRWFRFTLLVILFVVSGCYDTPNLLRVGTNQWPGYEFMYLAKQSGFYQSDKIRLVEFPDATSVMQAFSSGSLEVAALTLDEALSLHDDGINIKILAILDSSNGADNLIAQPHITNLSQLRGRRIGVENTAVGSLMINAILQKAHLTIKDIILVPLSAQRMSSAFIKKEVDAVVTFEPFSTTLELEGGVKLFDSSEIKEQILDVLITHPEALNTHVDDIKMLLTGHFKALNNFINHPSTSSHILAERLGIKPDELLKAYRQIKLYSLNENYDEMQNNAQSLKSTTRKIHKLMHWSANPEQSNKAVGSNYPKISSINDLFLTPREFHSLYHIKGKDE
jgi:NitT/TauT family transport system substrate-binding protein